MIDKPLVVDLDGTLLKCDLLHECANVFLMSKPFAFVLLIKALFKGKPQLKAYLAERVSLPINVLPINRTLVSWLEAQRRRGRKIVLASASHKTLVEKIAQHFSLFDAIHATEGNTNLSGSTKRDLLVKVYGFRGFDYIGNSAADLVVWESANKAYVVSTSSSLLRRANKMCCDVSVIAKESSSCLASFFEALRFHQWIKNLLVFVPLVLAHRIFYIEDLYRTFIAFIAFSLVASSVYILNDLSDLSDDRRHHRKKFRPFAAGDLSLVIGWSTWPFLLVIGFSLSIGFIPIVFSCILLFYFILTTAYSIKIKQLPILDVITLSGLYTVRIVAGAVAISVALSFWLLAFSLFIFLSLAYIKRFSELKSARDNGNLGYVHGRGYTHQDLELVSSMGASAGYLSVLVLALYIQDVHTARLYNFPELIWVACPILLYWISRAWLIAHRGAMHDDPVVFAIKDPLSWFAGAIILSIFILATFAQ